jgi:NitT/TauT family transport system permease protein
MKKLAIPLSLASWALLWEIGARAAGNDMFPPVSEVVRAAVELVPKHDFQAALWVTARSLFLGLTISIVLGVPIGALMARMPTLDRIFNVWINIFISAPLTALVPALMPLLGIGEPTVVATVVLFSIWVVIIDTREGVMHVPLSLIEMARMNGASRLQLFVHILIPSALPEVMTGIRLSVVRAVKGVIIGQVIVSLIGFGALFSNYLQQFEMAYFWALVMIVFVLGFAMMGVVSLIEKLLTPAPTS